MSGVADRARAVGRPGGTSVLLVALLLAVSASGCSQLDDSIDSLTLRLEEWDRHRHDTAGKSGQGTALPHQASVREWEPEPAQRSARVRGTLIAGLAVSRADTPPAGGTGLHRFPTGQEAQPPRQARRAESPQVKQGLAPGVGSAMARTRVATPEAGARLLASGLEPVKAMRQAVSVSAPRLQGVVRGRWIQSTEPSDVVRPSMGDTPPQLLARLESVRAPDGAARVERWRRSPGAVSRHTGPEELCAHGSCVASGGRMAGPPLPAVSGSIAGGGRGLVLADRRFEWDPGPPHPGHVQGGLERRAREDHLEHRVNPPPGDRAGHGARLAIAGPRDAAPPWPDRETCTRDGGGLYSLTA